MPTALIADDEEAPRAQLLMALREAWPELQVLQECVNGVDAWDAFLEHEPDVCFLDVRMPGLTGIEVAQRIGARAHIVFVTAHGDHALAAFDAGAVDYVLKPVDVERLAQAVARVKARLAAPSAAPADLQLLLNQLVGQVRKPAPLDVIQAGVGKEVRLVRVEDVVYFESDSRYTRVVYTDGPGEEKTDGEVLIRTPLKELIAQLDASKFWQIHRSTIVNHCHIASAVRIDEGNMLLTLRGRSEKLPVSRHFQGLFRGQ
ncbi:MAG: LytTR family DNA-binding domain-containing protein [Burkholderiales bacterium]